MSTQVAEASAFDAVILAGGTARRLGGVDKPGIEMAGQTLLERVAAAVATARRTIVVGPERPRPPARYVREDPPGAGPVPAVRAGLTAVRAPWCALLAGDMPLLDPRVVDRLRGDAREQGADGAVLVDDAGRFQWLAGVWSTRALDAALAVHRGTSLRGLLAPLDPVPVPWHGAATLDCDTPQDVVRIRRALSELPREERRH